MTNAEVHPEIVVIGAGLVGCGVTYQLARRGRRVLLLERRNIASGATGRCGGMVMKIDGRDTRPAEIAKRWRFVSENDRMLDAFPEELEADIGLWRRGSLDIACRDEEMDQLQAIWRMQKTELGDEEIQLLDARALHALSPVLSERCKGARYRPSDGCLDPFQLTHALVRKACELGAAVRTWCPVREIVTEAGRVAGVRTDAGLIPCDAVVNATNGWAASLTPELPVVPLRALAVITEPAPALPALTFEAELSMKIVYGCTQTRRGNILVGGPPEKPATMTEQFDETVSRRELAFNSSVLTEFFPGLARLNVIRAWSGAMGNTPDGMPCVGRVSSCEGLYVAAGYPNGMSYAPVTARLLAELIAEGDSSIPLDALDPNRFAGISYTWPERYDYTVLAEYLDRAGQPAGNRREARLRREVLE
ncbi:MAG: FAD-binding oxidoreductase [Kiritimatiellae bacterium]|nr:FAD-binding oxidoreductase [Kiritimatiellia bacterium]